MIPEFTDTATFGDLLNPAMDIAKRGDKDEAARFTTEYVAYLLRRNPDWDEARARETVMRNVGYYAGYYGPEEREAVHRVFGAEHPVFGTRTPTADEAFDAGRRWAL